MSRAKSYSSVVTREPSPQPSQRIQPRPLHRERRVDTDTPKSTGSRWSEPQIGRHHPHRTGFRHNQREVSVALPVVVAEDGSTGWQPVPSLSLAWIHRLTWSARA